MAIDLRNTPTFTKKISELDPASTLDAQDAILVSQSGTTRKASITQVREGLAATSSVTSHISNTANPHGTTASQVGAFTTQQTTAAIASAQNAVQTNIDTHTSSNSNPHEVSAAQVGAYTKGQTDSRIQAAQDASTTYTDTHIQETNNPHQVTAADVGNNTPQWNANKISGKSVSLPTNPTDLSVLTYIASSNQLELRSILANSPPHPTGAVVHLPFKIDPNSLYTDDTGWLWYTPTGKSIGSLTSNAYFNDDRLEKLYKALWFWTDEGDGWQLKNSSNARVSKGVSAQVDWDNNVYLDLPNLSERTIIAADDSSWKAGKRVGTRFQVIKDSNLPEVKFRRNNGTSASNSPFSITADNNKGGFDANSTGAINTGSPNDPINIMQPSVAMSMLWFTGVRA